MVTSASIINTSALTLLAENATDIFSWWGENFIENEIAAPAAPFDKRELIRPYAGYPVTGISMSERSEPYEVSCSLSFPVVNEDGIKGFLMSFICTNSNVLLGGTQIGINQLPWSYDKDRGLDYIFLKIYDGF